MRRKPAPRRIRSKPRRHRVLDNLTFEEWLKQETRANDAERTRRSARRAGRNPRNLQG